MLWLNQVVVGWYIDAKNISDAAFKLLTYDGKCRLELPLLNSKYWKQHKNLRNPANELLSPEVA